MTSLSRTLLKRVLTIYFALTLLVTVIQVVVEYISTQQVIEEDLIHTLNSVKLGLSQSIWEINPEQVEALVDGLIRLPMVVGVEILHEDTLESALIGITPELRMQMVDGRLEAHTLTREGRLFGVEMPLMFGDGDARRSVGRVALYSSDDVTISRIKVSLIFLVLNAMFKTAVLMFMFLWVFNKFLSKPLRSFITQIEKMDLHNLEKSNLHLQQESKNELTLLSQSFNQLVDKLIENRHQLDSHNAILAEEVENKTHALQETLSQVEAREQSLTSEVTLRLRAEHDLKASYAALKRSQGELGQAQNQLIESEKLTSLGEMVAEITHELNTPIGIAITTSSFLESKMQSLEKGFSERSITTQQMEQFLAGGLESAELIRVNMQRAAEIVSDFKVIAVDEASNRQRTINLNEYLHGIVHSLYYKYKRTKHAIKIECDPEILCHCRPGAISQIIINLIVNSLVHGFENQENGVIRIIGRRASDDRIELVYTDNGVGVEADKLNRIFEPFFTTKKDQGGSGLGTHIIRKLVTEDLAGEVVVESAPGAGMTYTILLPVNYLPG